MKTPIVLSAVLAASVLMAAGGCAVKSTSNTQSSNTPSQSTPTPKTIAAELGLQSEMVTAADHPVALAFAPDGRLFFAEKFTGDVRIIGNDGELLPEPFAHVDVANRLDEDWGLTGLALDPDFATNHFVYLFYTEPVVSDSARPIAKPKLVRLTDATSLHRAGTMAAYRSASFLIKTAVAASRPWPSTSWRARG